jgi:hypothetical protein
VIGPEDQDVRKDNKEAKKQKEKQLEFNLCSLCIFVNFVSGLAP